MENSKKTKVSKFSICMYVLSAIIFIYFIFLLFNTQAYLAEIIASGQASLKTDFADIVRLYVTNCGSYLFYSIIFLAFGFIANVLISFVQRFSNALLSDEDFDDDFDADEDFEEEFELEFDGDFEEDLENEIYIEIDEEGAEIIETVEESIDSEEAEEEKE